MRKCAFLTMDNMEGFVSDDELAVEPLATLGWQVQFLSWRQTAVAWHSFDLVIIRTTWDYPNDAEAFLTVLEQINRETHLENDIRIVRWNMDKSYLADLRARGIGIVPTVWEQDLTEPKLHKLFGIFDEEELIVKPVVGANAGDTYWINAADDSSHEEALAAFQNRPFMAQPFMPSVVGEGEFSLFFFAGEYSHAILKSPQVNDFRVQEEHGGLIQAVEPDPLLLQRAQSAVAVIEPLPLYARVDMVRTRDNDFVVMEFELIEPSLYLRMDENAPVRFASALNSWFKNLND